MLKSIILAVVIMFAVAHISHRFNGGSFVTTIENNRRGDSGGAETRRRLTLVKKTGHLGWVKAVIIALTVGVINYLMDKDITSKLGAWLWLAPLFLAIMLGLSIHLMVWWHRKGNLFGELVPFVILAGLFFLVTKATAWATASLWHNLFWTSVITTLPTLMLVFTLAFFCVDMLFDRSKSDEDGAGDIFHSLAWLAIILTLIILLAIFIRGVGGLGSLVGKSTAEEAELAAAETVEPEEVQQAEPEVETEDDNANTAVSAEELEAAVEQLTVTPVTAEELEQLTVDKYDSVSWYLLDSSLTPKDLSRTKSTGFSDALTFGFESEEDAKRFAELQVEILRNPVYGVTVANAIKDKKIGDKTIGSFNPWLEEMTAPHSVSYWLEKDQDGVIYVTKEYRCYAATLCTWLERLVLQGVHAWPTVENWCLNASAKNDARAGVPASYQYTKDALILAYVGKNDAGAEVGVGSDLFVIGFNVHDKRPEFYGGTPEEPTPSGPVTPEPEPTPDNPTPTPKPKPDPKPDPDPKPKPDPEPEPDPDPKYNKDPEKAPKENTEPNDDPGPGPSTNNGPGATTSTADQPTNSNHYESPKDYKDDVDDLAKTNQNQKTGSDSDKPSTPKPTGDTKVDNNGGEINKPTQTTSQPAEVNNGPDNPAGNWGGPPD